MSVSRPPDDASVDDDPDVVAETETEDEDKISVLQLVAATGASTTAALVANLLGVMGTVVGVAVISVVSSLGTVLYLRSMKRTGRKIKQVVQHVPTPLRHPAPTMPTADASTPPLPRGDDDTLVDMEPVPEDAAVPSIGRRAFPWKRFALSTVAVFALSIVALTIVAVMSGDPPATYWNQPGQTTTTDGEERPEDADEQPQQPASPSDDEPSPTDTPSPDETPSETPGRPTPTPTETDQPTPSPEEPEPSEPAADE